MLQQTNLAADNVTAVEWEKAGALQELDITGTDLPQVIFYQSKQKIDLWSNYQTTIIQNQNLIHYTLELKENIGILGY